MNQTAQRQAPAGYRIRVEGHLDQRWSTWFDGMQLSRSDGTTVLEGPVPDQAALHGLLTKVRDMGLTLVSVNRESPGAVDDPSTESETRHRQEPCR